MNRLLIDVDSIGDDLLLSHWSFGGSFYVALEMKELLGWLWMLARVPFYRGERWEAGLEIYP